jgi:hypothetical protein
MESLKGTPSINMPDLQGADYIAVIALECGVLSKQFSWQELTAYQQATGRTLTAWESTTLHAMHTAYVTFSSKALSQHCMPPHFRDDRSIEEKRAAIDKALRSAFAQPDKKQRAKA